MSTISMLLEAQDSIPSRFPADSEMTLALDLKKKVLATLKAAGLTLGKQELGIQSKSRNYRTFYVDVENSSVAEVAAVLKAYNPDTDRNGRGFSQVEVWTTYKHNNDKDDTKRDVVVVTMSGPYTN